ncbi:hypothetical protein EKK58_03045 [Candidatus Dependentiae bacterium]|nr:MAG: hypothetical protein EKK58_03045 [Candidatus Dependentiae bacterium]
MDYFEKLLPKDLRSYISILCAMIKKDLFLLKQKTADIIINSAIILTMELIVWCYLYPLLGMPQELVLPMFVGWPLISIMINLGFCFSMKYTLGALYTGYGFMEFDLTLPLPTSYVLAKYIISFVIEACIATLPLILIGITIIQYLYPTVIIAGLLPFCLLYIMNLSLIAIVFLALSFWYPNQWFENNVWPRRIGPIITFGAVFAPWHQVYVFSKPIGILMLLNPLTYVTEAMRSVLLKGNGIYISLWFCIPILILLFLVSTLWMSKSVRSKLDLLS